MLNCKIDRLDDFGRGITKVNGKVCFVSNALDEEVVEVIIDNEKSKYMEGHSTKIIEENSNRVNPVCPYYLECGGCSLMHASYDYQLGFKKNKVINALNRYSGINGVVKGVIPTKQFNYRNKVTLKVVNGKIGYYKRNSHEIVSIDNCLLCSDKINEVIKDLSEIELKNIDEVMIRSNYKNEVLLVLKGRNITIPNIEKYQNVVLINNNKEKVIKGNNYLIDKINNMLFRVSYDSFFQVNSVGVEKLYEKVKEYAKGKNVLDLYCGTGTIGLSIASKCSNIFGVEIVKNAILDANYNKELNRISNADFLCNDVARVKEKFKDIDLVIIDPPRSGLSKDAIKNIMDINSSTIIYVSCDVLTLSRDLNILKEKYNIKSVDVVDMFPNTYHCESITVLERR